MSKLWYVLFALVSVNALADSAPECEDRGANIAVNNDQVIQWKSSTRNSFQARGHVVGPILQVYPDHSGHHHFEISLSNKPGDTIEVIFNEDFGSVPALRAGQQVEACGDYITSNAPSGPYPASPDNAILHWVHASPHPQTHPSGYMMVDGVVYGQDTANAGPKRRH
jgi:hypothetical protein